MTTEPKLPAGVWRDDEEAAKLQCPYAQRDMASDCLGTACAACREYRLTNWERVDEESREITEIDSGACVGYYCGKAGRP